jgi:hypothetical protein
VANLFIQYCSIILHSPTSENKHKNTKNQQFNILTEMEFELYFN